MAELSLCRGNLATTPYYLSGLGVNIYSIEELCYSLWQNAYILDKDLLDEKLCKFIEKQLNLKELADELKQMLDEKKGVGEFATAILAKTDYLSEEELKEVKQILLDNAMLDFAQKRKARGDSLLRSKKFTLAIEEYQYLLQQIDKSEETELYAAVLHNIGTAYAYMYYFEKAAYYYREAADLTDTVESKEQYLMATRLTLHKEKYDKLILRYGFDEKFLAEIDRKMEESRSAAESPENNRELLEIKELKLKGKITDYYKEIDRTLSSWKQKYRRNMSVRSM